ncbi:hypothetical protein [Anabaena sp. UHCC 0451]|uniref:hypothetical protein n=1 Tax=Anabaena sp. UHCC 0451 TaxID=2055235 RepID=UPI002B202CB7|nr:hypothetical protein [Anabaena sp. UHCC 0451]MEA5578147.1 hypothetical protein [Anabaena sp. UHCC 0451]
MAKITITDLQPIDADRLIGYIKDIEAISIFGGNTDNFSELVNYGIKSMEFILLAYAINSISNLASSFNSPK